MPYKEENGNHYVNILTEYHNSLNAEGVMSIELIRVSMKTELSEENIKNGTFKPINEWDANMVISIPTTSKDSRAEEALKKLKDDNQVDYNDLKNITTLNIGGSLPDTVLGCGVTGVIINRIDGDKIITLTLMVKSDGGTKDIIGENLINGTLGTTYRVVETFKYEFGENVILLGEMFKEDASNEVLDVFEHEGQMYAIIRNRYADLKRNIEEPESY